MIITNRRIFTLIIVLLICITALFCRCQNDDIKLKVFEIEEGRWGYKIDVKGKQLIDQTFVPVVEGYKPFKTKEDALKTGKLVMRKMKEEGMFPSISLEEIEELNLESL